MGAILDFAPVSGPGGVTAVLKVSSADDHSKNSHDCNADYHLLVTPAQGGSPVTVDLTSSDADYGRSLSLGLDGFSKDGKRVFGILAEGGKYRATLLFDYHVVDSTMQVVDLKAPFARVMPAGCSETLDVVGTTKGGAIVLELTSQKPCGTTRRWLIDPVASKPPHPLSASASFWRLYESKQNVQ